VFVWSSPRSCTIRRRHRVVPVVAGLLVAFVMAACGGGDEPEIDVEAAGDATEVPGTVALVGRDDLTWNTETVSAPSGTITVQLSCEPAVNHNVVIDELDALVVECAPGETVSGTVELEPGTYTYVCTVPGHERTMRGVLTVD
jgi:plastocyanin